MLKTLLFFVVSALLLFTLQAHAALSPLGLAVLAPVQFPPEDFTVTGVRVSALWGRHRQVYGFDFGGIGNFTDADFTGIGVSGIFNATKGPTNIILLQGAGVANVNSGKCRVYGLQVAGMVNWNSAESTITGLQIAPVANYSPFAKIAGIQAGIYNKAHDVYGFQIGIVNVTENLHGLQIGVLNFNAKGLFAIAPILNVGF